MSLIDALLSQMLTKTTWNKDLGIKELSHEKMLRSAGQVSEEGAKKSFGRSVVGVHALSIFLNMEGASLSR